MAWHKLCNLDDVPPGELWAYILDGIEMIVLRGHEGYLVIPPTCPHMATPLIEGFFDGRVLTCSKHLWQWSVPGGQSIGEAERPLLKYDAQTRGSEIWVNLVKELLYDHQCEVGQIETSRGAQRNVE